MFNFKNDYYQLIEFDLRFFWFAIAAINFGDFRFVCIFHKLKKVLFLSKNWSMSLDSHTILCARTDT